MKSVFAQWWLYILRKVGKQRSCYLGIIVWRIYVILIWLHMCFYYIAFQAVQVRGCSKNKY